MSGDNGNENARTEMNEKEQSGVVGGTLASAPPSNPPSTVKCQYCDETFASSDECAQHEAICPKNPGNVRITVGMIL